MVFAGALAAGALVGTAAPAAADCSVVDDFSDLMFMGDPSDFSDLTLAGYSGECSEDCYDHCGCYNNYCRSEGQLECFVDCVKGCP